MIAKVKLETRRINISSFGKNYMSTEESYSSIAYLLSYPQLQVVHVIYHLIIQIMMAYNTSKLYMNLTIKNNN